VAAGARLAGMTFSEGRLSGEPRPKNRRACRQVTFGPAQVIAPAGRGNNAILCSNSAGFVCTAEQLWTNSDQHGQFAADVAENRNIVMMSTAESAVYA
jgi:hypothetical protein